MLEKDLIKVEKKLSLIKKLFLFVLPTLMIISQFFYIGPVRVSWIIYCVVLLYLISKGRITINYSIMIFVIVFIFYPLVSYWWSSSEQFEIELFISIITGLIVMIFCYLISQNEFDILFNGVLFSCVLFTLWGVFEIFTGKYILFINNNFLIRLNSFGRHYPGVAFTNTNDLAQYLCMLSPIAAIYCFEKEKKFFKLISVLLLIGNLFVIYNSDCHMGMIVECLTLIIFVAFLLMQQPFSLKAILFILIGLLIVLVLESKFKILSSIYNDMLLIDTSASYFTVRQEIYNKLINQAVNHPLGGFGNAYSITSPHNFYLFILDDYGLLIFIMFLCFTIMLLLKIFINREQNILLYYILIASFLLFPFSSSISSGNEQRKALWLFLGLIIRFAFKKHEKKY